MNQISLFDGKNDFKIKNKIRLIELFAGYGSQAFALKYLNKNFEHYKICEWAVKSIQAYKDAHFNEDNRDYSQDYSKDQVIDYLYKRNISMDYNKPMTLEEIKRLGETRQRQIFNNIKATNNLVDIQQTSGSDLEIVETDKYCYIMTYSFPCQDLSKAGRGAGMAKGSGTRSGMLWEVERILDECKDSLPQVLLMENVPDVVGSKNIQHFANWLAKLEKLGYKCYWQILNAKDYGVPQNRDRCFMVSLLGDYFYRFPQKQELTTRLKDLLEENVDEKFYLSDKAILGRLNTNFKASDLEHSLPKNGICSTLTATDAKRPRSVAEPTLVELTKNQSQGNRVYDPDGLSVSLCANGGGLGAKTGLYAVPQPICLNSKVNGKQPSVQDRVYDINGVSTAITTSFMLSIAEETYLSKKYAEFEQEHGYISDMFNPYNKSEIKDIAPAQTTNSGSITTSSAVIIKTKNKRLNSLVEKLDFNEDTKMLDCYNQKITDKATTITARIDDSNHFVYNNFRIRKLTPKECFRLMGVKDEDFEKIAKNQSNSSLYHLAGDSIVVNVLMAIFRNMFKEKTQ